MTLDDVIDRALAKGKGPSGQCRTCQIVRDGLLSDEKLAEGVKVLGAPKVAAEIRAKLEDAPGPDAIRRHLANHVA
jgi:hypothetical protein